MNIAIENLFDKVSKTLILLILVLMITYSLYNVLSYKTSTYSKPIKNTYLKQTMFMEDSTGMH